MSVSGLECPVSKWVNPDTCPRPRQAESDEDSDSDDELMSSESDSDEEAGLSGTAVWPGLSRNVALYTLDPHVYHICEETRRLCF